jgi:hypothetical protein
VETQSSKSAANQMGFATAALCTLKLFKELLSEFAPSLARKY